MLRTPLRALLVLPLLALVALPPPAAAVVPSEEINDIQWCVDQTSETVQDTVRQWAAAIADTYEANYRSLKCKLHQRPPIVISAPVSGPPEALLAQYGIVRGRGTQYDPFVIENWEIAGSDAATVHTGVTSATTPAVPEYSLTHPAGIQISYTGEGLTQHFVISKVYVHGFPYGIRISGDATPPAVAVRDSVLLDNAVGIRVTGNWQVWHVSEVTIDRNHIRASQIGIDGAPASTNMRIRDNLIEGLTGGEGMGWSSRHGIRLGHIYTMGDSYEISRNRISAPSVGMTLQVHGDHGYGNLICATHPIGEGSPIGVSWSRWWC